MNPTDQSYEVELKYPIDDPAALIAQLRELNAVELPATTQQDHYLSHPARDFAQTGEVLRIRIDNEISYITYKGPKLSGRAKTREEIEIPCAPGPHATRNLQRLFDRLGFRPVAVVHKHRRPFQLRFHERSVLVVLDEVLGLGRFAEVETMGQGLVDLSAAEQAVVELATRLGLTHHEPRSYLRMLLDSARSSSPTP